jgi:hypothetical protein
MEDGDDAEVERFWEVPPPRAAQQQKKRGFVVGSQPRTTGWAVPSQLKG